jgi:hypothetical protein
MPSLHKNIMTQDAATKKRGVQVSHVEKNMFLASKNFFGTTQAPDSLEEIPGGDHKTIVNYSRFPSLNHSTHV